MPSESACDGGARTNKFKVIARPLHSHVCRRNVAFPQFSIALAFTQQALLHRHFPPSSSDEFDTMVVESAAGKHVELVDG